MTIGERYWFPAKRRGWGWGPPSTWQGWVVVGLFSVLVIAAVLAFPPGTEPVRFVAAMAALCATLFTVCWLKGEPPRWRWER